MKRVVITGIGGLCGLGIGQKAISKGLLEGSCGIRTIEQFDTADFPIKIGGEIQGFNPKDFFSALEDFRMDRFTQFALIAAEEAIKDSGLEFGDKFEERAGCFVGAGMGGLGTIEMNKEKLDARGPKRINPFFIPASIINTASGKISMTHDIRGVNFGHVSACASGAHSIGEAFRAIKHGYFDVMVSGGAESTLTPLGLGGFVVIKALSNYNTIDASRPFDKTRNGFVAGEGAAIFTLEELEHAKTRGAKIYGEIVGYGATSDAHHITAPHPDGRGAKACMKMAINEAGIDSNKVDYINAHGTSTPYNDKTETLAIKDVFGDHAHQLKISSTKSMTGHLLGASGALETLACLTAISEQAVPPTINYKEADPDCDLDYVPNQSQNHKIDYAISNSFGFGGTNACLAFKKYSD